MSTAWTRMKREVRKDDDDDDQEEARHSHHAGVLDGSRALPLHPHDGDDRSNEGCKAQPDEPAHKSAFRQDESACRKDSASVDHNHNPTFVPTGVECQVDAWTEALHVQVVSLALTESMGDRW